MTCGHPKNNGEPCSRETDGGKCWQHEDSPFNEIQHPKKRAFLTAFALTGSKTKACKSAEIDQSTPYTKQWLEDNEFQAALERARRMAVDALESEAVRRAMEGVEKPVGFYKGQPSTYVLEYSDTLLIVLLKAHAPERYVERIQHAGPQGGPIPITQIEYGISGNGTVRRNPAEERR